MALSQEIQQVNYNASERNCDTQPSLKHGKTLTKPHAAESVREKMARIAPKDDGLLPSAQEDAVRTELCEQSTPTGREEKSPMEYVLDRVIDNRVDGQRLHYCVRWFGYGPSDDTLEPVKHLPLQCIVRYGQRSS